MGHIYPVDRSGRCLPHRQTRLGDEAHISSEDRKNSGSHIGLLPFPGYVADITTLDEGIRTWDITEKASGRDARNQIPRCPLAGKRKKDQASGGSHCTEGVESAASEDEGDASQQIKN